MQGTGCGGAGDCQKFVIKYKDKAIERMELPTDFTDADADYDIGLFVDVERDNENNVYRISCPYLDDTILMEIPKDDEDWGGGSNCRGYHTLTQLERQPGSTLRDTNISMRGLSQTELETLCFCLTGTKTERFM